MDEELDYGEEEAAQEGLDEQHEEDAYAGAVEEASLYIDLQQDAAGSFDLEQRAPPANAGGPPAAGSGGTGPAPGSQAPAPLLPARTDTVPEEWQVMSVPDEWRPRPMVRVWGLPAAASEAEVRELLEAQGLELGVRSVVLDPKQATAAGKVALVRFQPPAAAPLADPGAPLPPEPDVGKTAEQLIAALRAKAPELHGKKINVEKTGAEVCLFLSNLPPELEDDGALRAWCEQHGGVERCFVVRNPAGDSKRYAFAEFTLPSGAAACKEAWNKAGDAQRPQAHLDPAERKYVRVKLQRAEAAPVRSVAGLFASTLYVDNLAQSCANEPLRRLFSEYGEVTSCHLPRSTANPSLAKGFAFVHFRHSFAADAAFRALDGTDHEGIGRLLISFSNPVKAAEALHRAATGGTGAARTDSRHTQQPRHQQQREGSGAGGRASVQGSYGASGAGRSGGGMAAGGASRAGTILAPGGRMASGGMAGLSGAAPIILPGAAMPPPPPPPNPMLMQQQALQQAQAAMQQRLAMQQMLLMQQQPLLAMQQAMMAQAAEAAKKEEEERRRKEAERQRAEEEKARQEAEYAARLGYGMGGFGGMAGAAALGSLAGNPMAAMAAAAGLPGFGAAFGAGLGGGGGLSSGLGAGMAGLGGLGGTAGGTAAAGNARARSPTGAADTGRNRAAGGEYGRTAGGEYGGHAGNGGARHGDEYGGDAGYARGGRGGSNRGGGGGYRPDEWGEDWDSNRGGVYDAYDEDYAGSNTGAGYGGRGGSGYGGSSRGGGYGGRSTGGGYGNDSRGGGQNGGNRGGGAKRDTGYQAYADSYTHAPKRPRY